MHPYVARIFGTLGDHDPIETLEMTPTILEGYLLSFFDTDFGRSYAPGKWTAQEILAHLADVELGLGFRFRQVLTTKNYTPESFDQNAWAGRYTRLEPSLAVETFRALRAWNLALFSSFDLSDWNKSVDYPFEGVDTTDAMVRLLAGHDLNHLAQLKLIADSLLKTQ